MILVLFLFGIIIFIMLVIIFMIVSTTRIMIRDFELASKKRIEPKYEVKISLYFLNKIKWMSFRLNNKKMRSMYTKMHLEKIDIKKIEKNVTSSDIKEIIRMRPKLSHLNLFIKIGVDDVIINSYIIPLICAIFSIILPNIIDRKNIRYKIDPVYNDTMYHIKLDTTIEIKIINMLNSIIRIYKSKKKDTQNLKTSDVLPTQS